VEKFLKIIINKLDRKRVWKKIKKILFMKPRKNGK
jgi:hypothetical protein